jgi:hypothetical protein
VLRGQRNNLIAATNKERIVRDNERVGTVLDKGQNALSMSCAVAACTILSS